MSEANANRANNEPAAPIADPTNGQLQVIFGNDTTQAFEVEIK